MGRAKQKYIEDDDLGFVTGRDLCVCEKHFTDKDISDYIKLNGNSISNCSFCDEKDGFLEGDNEYKAISWDILMHRIIPGIKHFYDDPANGLSYMSSEGGYQGATYDTLELLNEIICLEADYEVTEEIANTITGDIWTKSEFYSDNYANYLMYTWESFSKLVKYDVRYLFKEVNDNRDEFDPSYQSFKILENIGEFITKLNLLITVPCNTNFFDQEITLYRARQHKIDDEVIKCKDIGSTPGNFAGANRFSPEGISIFYGAEDELTAILEVINTEYPDEYLSIGEFYPTKELNLIDLRRIKPLGIFNVEEMELIEPSQFLSNFTIRISKKFNKDENERIEYVPTQIVTEYFRHVLPSQLKIPIHGLIYKSAQNLNKDCYAIFANENLCSDEINIHGETLLALRDKSIRRIEVSSIET